MATNGLGAITGEGLLTALADGRVGQQVTTAHNTAVALLKTQGVAVSTSQKMLKALRRSEVEGVFNPKSYSTMESLLTALLANNAFGDITQPVRRVKEIKNPFQEDHMRIEALLQNDEGAEAALTDLGVSKEQLLKTLRWAVPQRNVSPVLRENEELPPSNKVPNDAAERAIQLLDFVTKYSRSRERESAGETLFDRYKFNLSTSDLVETLLREIRTLLRECEGEQSPQLHPEEPILAAQLRYAITSGRGLLYYFKNQVRKEEDSKAKYSNPAPVPKRQPKADGATERTLADPNSKQLVCSAWLADPWGGKCDGNCGLLHRVRNKKQVDYLNNRLHLNLNREVREKIAAEFATRVKPSPKAKSRPGPYDNNSSSSSNQNPNSQNSQQPYQQQWFPPNMMVQLAPWNQQQSAPPPSHPPGHQAAQPGQQQPGQMLALQPWVPPPQQ